MIDDAVTDPGIVTRYEPAYDDGGLLGRGMTRLFGRSWKTGALGFLTFALGIAPLVPGLPSWVTQTSAALLPLVVGGGLMVAKDGTVSGNTNRKAQP